MVHSIFLFLLSRKVYDSRIAKDKLIILSFLELGFSSEFRQPSKGHKCRKGSNVVLKDFIPVSEEKNDMIAARSKCEHYCSFQDNCWGCSVFCEGNCSWSAITNCASHQSWEGEIESGITQKPGNTLLLFNTNAVVYKFITLMLSFQL